MKKDRASLIDLIEQSTDATVRQIVRAFPSSPIPPPSNLVENANYGDSELISSLGGRSWTELSLEEIRWNEEGIPVLTVPAFAYYLPAYMAGSIIDPVAVDVVPGTLCSNLTPEFDRENRCRALRCILSYHQREVIIDVMRKLTDVRPPYEDDAEVWLSVLSDFWLTT